MTPQTIDEIIAAAEARYPQDGTADARKRGRNPKWPWVPIIRRDGGKSAQVLGLAYATKSEAVQAAQDALDQSRASIRRKLADRRYRALREQYGLPRELSDLHAAIEGERR